MDQVILTYQNYNPGHLSDLPALCKWLGASANANFNLQASATNKLILESDQFCVGTFWSSIMRPWKSFSSSSLSRQCKRNAAQTYNWNIAKPSDSAKQVSQSRIVQGSGISLVRRLFIQRNENCRQSTPWRWRCSCNGRSMRLISSFS